MFRKKFTVKGNVNMRNSERRKLLSRIDRSEVLSSQKQVSHIKIITGKGLRVDIYSFDKNPMFFQVEGDENLYPSVYFTWIASSFPLLFTHAMTFTSLENGADLMLPGIILKDKLPEFKRGVPINISVVSGDGLVKGPLAVGVSLMSSIEMLASGMNGRGVRILHVFRDYLWEFGDRSSPPENFIQVKPLSTYSIDDFPPLSAESSTQNLQDSNDEIDKVVSYIDSVEVEESEDKDEQLIQTEEKSNDIEVMDELLQRCFLAALKYRVGKDTNLPLNVGEFYSHHLLKTIPAMRKMDMKKTRFKKFSNFITYINELTEVPIIKVMAKAKGVEEITEINWAHSLLKQFQLQGEVIVDGEVKEVKKVNVEEKFSVTEPSLPLFRLYGRSKGDLIDLNQIRQVVTAYVRCKDLNVDKRVSLKDDILSSLVKHNEVLIDWNTLIQKISSSLTKTYVVTKSDGYQKIIKKSLPKISFKIEQRAGNKKVTIVDNLVIYGVDCKRFCQQVQLGVATTANMVNNAPGCEGAQIIVQGNQVKYMNNLLNNEYGISDKYMLGLDLASKRKK